MKLPSFTREYVYVLQLGVAVCALAGAGMLLQGTGALLWIVPNGIYALGAFGAAWLFYRGRRGIGSLVALGSLAVSATANAMFTILTPIAYFYLLLVPLQLAVLLMIWLSGFHDGRRALH